MRLSGAWWVLAFFSELYTWEHQALTCIQVAFSTIV